MSRTPVTQITTAQRLSSLIKTARHHRRDKGLNGDLDRLPMLTRSKPLNPEENTR